MSEPQKKTLVVDQEKCIGCGTCIALCPEVFEFNDKGKSIVKNHVACETCDCQNTIDACPVAAIAWKEEPKP